MNRASIIFQVIIVYLLAAILCALPTWFAIGTRVNSLMASLRVVEDTALFAETQLKGYIEQSNAASMRHENVVSSMKTLMENQSEIIKGFVRTEDERMRALYTFVKEIDDDLELLEPVRQKRILRELRRR